MPETEAVIQLAESVRGLTDQIEAEKQARRQTNRRTAVFVVLLLALGGLAVKTNIDRLNEIESSRAEARVAACNGFNDQQARSRDGEKAQIRTLIDPARVLTAEQQERVGAALVRHDAAVDEAYPDRKCDPASIEAFYQEKQP